MFGQSSQGPAKGVFLPLKIHCHYCSVQSLPLLYYLKQKKKPILQNKQLRKTQTRGTI